uniref:BT4734/BF3469 family protein n=1 Tax=Algoriphagus sp. TaxID=1872435 RepID=UPI004047DB00
MLKESVLNVEVSCFKNYDTPQDPKTINLMIWLTSTKYKDKVESIRSNNNKKERDSCKATLPAITPSGIFSYRRQDNLINHSGLIQIDIDLTEKNKLISNWENLKSELMKLPNIAYLGRSVSGRGYWGLIPIPPDPDGHKLYFDSLKDIFLSNWGIELDDKPKNVASLRGYSFDEKAYFNHHAKPFLIKKTPNPKLAVPTKNSVLKSSKLGDWIIRKLECSQEGKRHGDRLKFSFLAGGFVANGYLDSNFENCLIESYLSQYSHIDRPNIQTKEIKAIRDGFRDGLNHPMNFHSSKV